MDNIKIHKYYRSYGYSLSSLLYRFLIADNELRTYFRLNLYYGILTTLLCLFAVAVITLSIACSSAVDADEKIFYDTQKETRKILPRRESIMDIRPAYTCVRKHLKQTEIFQEKCDKMLRKEQLEIELMKGRVSCINKLLKPEVSPWHRFGVSKEAEMEGQENRAERKKGEKKKK